MKFAKTNLERNHELSACYPIQLSKNRHPPKGPRFSPNPLVRVKRNVSRRLPRMNPIRLTRTRLPCYFWWIEKIEQPEEPRILPAARHAVNFAPGTSVTAPHHRLFPTRRSPLQRSRTQDDLQLLGHLCYSGEPCTSCCARWRYVVFQRSNPVQGRSTTHSPTALFHHFRYRHCQGENPEESAHQRPHP